MNIRLENKVRLRLSQHDYQQLEQYQVLKQSFQIGNLYSFEVEIVTNCEVSISQIFYEPHKLKIFLSPDDFVSIKPSAKAKSGIDFSGLNLQVDIRA